MKKYQLHMCFAAGMLVFGLGPIALTGQEDPQRFYDVEAYKAEITISFTYQYAQRDEAYRKDIKASQTFTHVFETAAGQIAAADMFQVERGDEDPGTAGQGNISDKMDMSAIAQAAKNSGLDPSVMDMLKQTRGEMQAYNVGLKSFKMWMANPASGGAVTSGIVSEYSEEEWGTMHCGEGQGMGTFTGRKTYGNNLRTNGGPGLSNPNSFIFLVNLANNSYSFSATLSMPRDATFTGKEYQEQCGTLSESELSYGAGSFVRIVAEKKGLIYKQDLPEGGDILSGSEVITDLFYPDTPFQEGDDWTVRITWKIYPAGG